MTLLAAVWSSPCAVGKELTADRLAEVAETAAAPWRRFLERSAALARADEDALRREVEPVGGSALAPPAGGDFRPPNPADRSWFAGEEAARLAAAVLSFQTPSGGWSKHIGYSAGPRTPGMQWTSQSDPGKKPRYQATFDNGATTGEIDFLATVWEATGRDDCAAAVRRGLAFVLESQYPNGGWPQVYPLQGGYHDNITLNDDAMTNVLELLRDVCEEQSRFACIDDELRRSAAGALAAGISCLLDMQIVADGRATGWCGQHDPLSLEPAAGREYEPPALASIETAHAVRFLMTIDKPDPRLVEAIEAGLAWLERAKVTGIAKANRDGRTVYVADETATDPLWARFYDLNTGCAIFPGKDGVIYPSFEEMAAANDKLGYDYYSTRPGSIIKTGQQKWRRRLAESRSTP